MGSAAPSTLRRVTRPPQQSTPAGADEQAPGPAQEGEVLDALPVLADGPGILRVQRRARQGGRDRSLSRAGSVAIPAVQAAAVVAGGFVAGAAVAGLVHRRQRSAPALAGGGRIGRALARGGSRNGAGAAELVQIVSSRTLLVDVHLLGTPDSPR